MHGRIIDMTTYARNGSSVNATGMSAAAARVDEDDDEGEVGRRTQRPWDIIFCSTCALAADPDTTIADITWRLVLEPERGRWQVVDLSDPSRPYERVMRGFNAEQQALLNDIVAMFLEQSA
jgi:hypothetical protein